MTGMNEYGMVAFVDRSGTLYSNVVPGRYFEIKLDSPGFLQLTWLAGHVLYVGDMWERIS